MDNVYCDGTEDHLSKCRFDGWGVSDCESGEAAGVICRHQQQVSVAPIGRKKLPKVKIEHVHRQEIAVRLAGGRVPSEGRVEIKLRNGGNLTPFTNVRKD